MTASDDPQPDLPQLPMAPSAACTAAVLELEQVNTLVQTLTLDTWAAPSAVPGWTVGDVATHLGLGLALYSRLLDAVLAGHGTGGLWRAASQITKRMAPVTGPAFNAVNNALPRVIDRALSPEVLKGQFATSTRTLRERLTRIGPEDYTRSIHYAGRPWPLTVFLGLVVNELAVHGWDMASRRNPEFRIGEEARAVVPWFYWSAASVLLHMPAGTTGTVQLSLSNPSLDMWWTLGGEMRQGMGQADAPDATCTGEANAVILVLAGRMVIDEALSAGSLTLSGSEALARAFLSGWKLS